MATYKQIQNETKRRCGFVPKTCWIADVKAALGLISRMAPNRIDAEGRKHPCPASKRSCLTKVVQNLVATLSPDYSLGTAPCRAERHLLA